MQKSLAGQQFGVIALIICATQAADGKAADTWKSAGCAVVASSEEPSKHENGRICTDSVAPTRS